MLKKASWQWTLNSANLETFVIHSCLSFLSKFIMSTPPLPSEHRNNLNQHCNIRVLSIPIKSDVNSNSEFMIRKQGRIQDLIRGGAPDRDRPKTAILGPQFCRILVLGPHFWWSGGAGPPGPPWIRPWKTKLIKLQVTQRNNNKIHNIRGRRVALAGKYQTAPRFRNIILCHNRAGDRGSV